MNKQIREVLKDWVIPPGFQSLIRQINSRRQQRPAVPPELEAEFARNIKFRDIHKGQRCFILATGPSINRQDLRPLEDEICIACSMFFLHKDYREIDPLYHVFAPSHPPYRDELCRKWLEINKVCSEKTTLFAGHAPYEYSLWNFLKQNSEFYNENIHFLNYCHSSQLDESNFKNPNVWDITKTLFAVRTVVYSAIEIAAYMGFKYIFLIGCDHDYLTDITRGSSAHFYEDKEGIDDSALWVSTEKYFLAYYIRWKQYRLMREYLEPQGCYIYNSTEGGLLDVFPRVTLAEALAGVHGRKEDL